MSVGRAIGPEEKSSAGRTRASGLVAAKPDKPRRSGARVRKRADRRVIDWGPAYLTALGQTGWIGAAAKAAGICRQTVWDRRKCDPEFREAEKAVREQAGELLEDEAWRRALGGIARFKFGSDGRPLIDPRTRAPYFEIEYSDKLLLALLKAYRPEKFRDGYVPPQNPDDFLSLDELEARMKEALA